jgi:hypothetical protein
LLLLLPPPLFAFGKPKPANPAAAKGDANSGFDAAAAAAAVGSRPQYAEKQREKIQVIYFFLVYLKYLVTINFCIIKVLKSFEFSKCSVFIINLIFVKVY